MASHLNQLIILVLALPLDYGESDHPPRRHRYRWAAKGVSQPMKLQAKVNEQAGPPTSNLSPVKQIKF